jgi:hypothetical protein
MLDELEVRGIAVLNGLGRRRHHPKLVGRRYGATIESVGLPIESWRAHGLLAV